MSGKNEELEKMFRVKDVIKKIPISRSGIWSSVKKGTFPKPVRIGARSVAWTQSQLDEWLESRREASNECI
jgi:prophage regulatory protein